MSLGIFQSSKNAYNLLQSIYQELEILTKNNFNSDLKILIHNIIDLNKTQLVLLYIKLQKLNKLPKTHILKNRYLKIIIRLICSKNNIDDADTHPIGQNLSIDLQSKIAQNILSVKRLEENKPKENNKLETDSFEYFVTNKLKLNYKRIVPNINLIILYGDCEINWVRVKFRNSETLTVDLEDLIKNAPEKTHIINIFKLDNRIIEIYHNDNFLVELLLYLENLEYIQNIIFYSDLRLFKKKVNCPLLIFSNIFKFFYCNFLSISDFIIINTKSLKKINRIFLYTMLFMDKNNLNISGEHFNIAPLSCLSGNNPNAAIKKKTNYIEPITDYESTLLGNIDYNNREEIDKQLDLRNTTMSYESLAYKARHIVYEVTQDRCSRMLNGKMLIGGCNLHEVILNPNN
uniref:P47 n=1 Tax=Faxonius propinquus nudivirus TaxID=3139431 RepID=A0AAU8GCQ5_9VIRU